MKHMTGNRLTLEETALAMWDPKTEEKPMSPMGILKIERRALEKLKKAFKKLGVNSFDDIFSDKSERTMDMVNTANYI